MQYNITLAHAGDYWIAFDYMFRGFGYNNVVPPFSSKKSLDIGIKHSPDQACFPFKVTIGNLFQAMDNGANVLAMIGGRTGICRLAYYSEMYKKILSDNGYVFDEFPIKIKKEMWTTLKRHNPDMKVHIFIKALCGFWKKLRLVEILREQCLLNRAYEKERGACTRLYKKLRQDIIKTDNLNDMRILKKKIYKSFKELPKDMNKKVVKIGIVGEFFLLIDQFSSLNIEEILGEMGVVLEVSESFSEFFVGSVKQIRFLDKFIPTERHKINKWAKPFINRPIGGHALQAVGHTILYAKEGFDGIIQLYPFTCMPEIAASAILPKVSKEYNIPILSLCFDEQTGVERIRTRLEAFVDMIRRKKQ